MQLLNRQQIVELLDSNDDNSLHISPLLNRDQQLGAISLDIRLGYDFQVSILTRKPSIDLSASGYDARPLPTYFQETRRDLGDTFVLYPDQVVVAASLEYFSLPTNIYADILSRSSYTRLGVHLSTMVQPGFRGCIPLELFNHGSTPIELVVGCRIAQARFFSIADEQDYLAVGTERKYHGDVRPTVSKADVDKDLAILNKAAKRI